VPWQSLHRHDAAPRYDAGELGLVRPEEPLADARVNPVGADQGIGFDRPAILEPDAHRFPCLFEPDAFRAEVDGAGLLAAHRALQYSQEIRTIDREIGMAVALDRDLAQVVELPALAAVPEADLLAFGLAGEPLQLFADAEREERPSTVRRELQPRPQLLQFRRLLEHLDVAAHPEERQRRGQSADAAACDENTGVAGHARNIHSAHL
jgi:hypothetical protein